MVVRVWVNCKVYKHIIRNVFEMFAVKQLIVARRLSKRQRNKYNYSQSKNEQYTQSHILLMNVATYVSCHKPAGDLICNSYCWANEVASDLNWIILQGPLGLPAVKISYIFNELYFFSGLEMKTKLLHHGVEEKKTNYWRKKNHLIY